MSSYNVGFAVDFFDAFCPFTTEELEDLVLGIPPTNRLRKSVWEWLTANSPYPTIPSSQPALGDLLSSPAGSSDHCEPTPAVASAFYLFLNGEVDPRLLDPQPTPSLCSKKKCPTKKNKGPTTFVLVMIWVVSFTLLNEASHRVTIS
ncbi:hypothetical protein O181_112399 [Austropuccinia psidii MF-1]|uniref:Uncharacterized protein n=1 Tax=Austropuccinia psidii MF-1 TaxID=1389203 RepID=A0A9Q3K1S9_9BASI|nr:hypothetical protein [Austropuccinia psidii MF-1]